MVPTCMKLFWVWVNHTKRCSFSNFVPDSKKLPFPLLSQKLHVLPTRSLLLQINPVDLATTIPPSSPNSPFFQVRSVKSCEIPIFSQVFQSKSPSVHPSNVQPPPRRFQGLRELTFATRPKACPTASSAQEVHRSQALRASMLGQLAEITVIFSWIPWIPWESWMVYGLWFVSHL